MRQLEAENSAPSNITDHPYQAPVDEPWGRCVGCGMAEAAHAEAVVPYSDVLLDQEWSDDIDRK